MKYIVTEDAIDFVKREVDFSFLAKPERKGYIRLYENNTWETHYLKIVEQCPNSRAWIVERKTPRPNPKNTNRSMSMSVTQLSAKKVSCQ